MVRRIEEASRASRTTVARMENPVTWSEVRPARVRADQRATVIPTMNASRIPRRTRPDTTPDRGTADFLCWWSGVCAMLCALMCSSYRLTAHDCRKPTLLRV